MFDVLCGTVVCVQCSSKRFCRSSTGAGWGTQPGEIRAEVGVFVWQGKNWFGWSVGSYNEVKRSVYKVERKKEGRICETGIDNAFRFLTLGHGACAWLPLHALEHTPFLECSTAGRAACQDAHVHA